MYLALLMLEKYFGASRYLVEENGDILFPTAEYGLIKYERELGLLTFKKYSFSVTYALIENLGIKASAELIKGKLYYESSNA